MEPGDPLPGASPASLGELGRCLWRARWVIGLWILGGLAVAAGWMSVARPSFRAQATILIEQQTSSGLLGDLAMLASIASAPAAASELSVLESRTLAELVLAEGRDEQGRWNPLAERNVGLTALVEDEALRPASLLARALLAPPPPGEPLVLPARGLLARVTAVAPDAPSRVRIEFLDAARVRLSSAGFLQRLRLASRASEERPFAPRTALEYRGLTLELEPWGDCAGQSFVLEYRPPHEALERLQERLEVRETALNSGVIEVALVDSDPRRAARTVNALCRNYMDALAARGRRRASKTVEYVQGLLDEEFERFERAQERIMRLQQAQPELIAPEGTASSLIEQMATLEVERIQLELSRRAFGEIVAALEAGDARALARIDSTLNVGVLVDPVTNGLLAELARLEAQASTLEADLLDGHPLVAKNRAATAGLLASTREQIRSRLAGLETRQAELADIQDELRARLAGMPEGIRDLAETRVELGIHREIVPYLIKSLQGAEITRSSAETWAELVDPAVPPSELAAPDPVRLLALGLVAGLGAGIAFVLVREPARGRVHGGDELRAASGAEEVFVLERLGQRELHFKSAPGGREAETIRALRSALRFAPDGSARKRIGVTSAPADACGSTLAAELALAYALEGRHTLLVEADLRRPALAARLALGPGGGLAAYLEAGTAWQELVQPWEGGPDVLCAGSARAAPGDLLARSGMERFLSEASAAYDAVVLALPGLEGASEVTRLARELEVLCLVHRARTLPRPRVAAAARALRAAGARALTGVLVRRS